jgi:hypothetical protein
MGSLPKAKRDRRVDVLRGLALVMIFVDHVPHNVASLFTLHDFGFCDAAEVFVLLAGLSSTMAYGRVIDRDGIKAGLRRVGIRCLRIYVYQAGLLIFTLVLVSAWARQFGTPPNLVGPLLAAGIAGLARGLMLQALPGFLDILPLYIVLMAFFPLLYIVLRSRPVLALTGSAAVWLIANLNHDVNLPNWLDDNGWYFNPFTWQFLFAIGAGLAVLMRRNGGSLPHARWLVALAWGYLAFAFVQSAPWADWGLPDLHPLSLAPPDKSHLAPLRLLDILALSYVVFSSERAQRLATSGFVRAVEACGKHSLEIFALGCALALVGRLAFRTWGTDWRMQIALNLVGLSTMCLTALRLEYNRARHAAPPLPAPAA